MRKEFIEKLIELAGRDDKIRLVIGDVGFSFIELFREKHPDKFLNVGAAEQKMMGMALGMTHEGLKPYVYTMKNFILARPYEFLRNDICMTNANVKLFGVAGSTAYRFLGGSHNLFEGEEENLTKHLPNLKTYYSKPEEVKELMEQEYHRSGPAYFAI